MQILTHSRTQAVTVEERYAIAETAAFDVKQRASKQDRKQYVCVRCECIGIDSWVGHFSSLLFQFIVNINIFAYGNNHHWLSLFSGQLYHVSVRTESYLARLDWANGITPSSSSSQSCPCRANDGCYRYHHTTLLLTHLCNVHSECFMNTASIFLPFSIYVEASNISHSVVGLKSITANNCTCTHCRWSTGKHCRMPLTISSIWGNILFLLSNNLFCLCIRKLFLWIPLLNAVITMLKRHIWENIPATMR